MGALIFMSYKLCTTRNNIRANIKRSDAEHPSGQTPNPIQADSQGISDDSSIKVTDPYFKIPRPDVGQLAAMNETSELKSSEVVMPSFNG